MTSKQGMSIREIYHNPEKAVVYTAAVISMIADRDRSTVKWKFALQDIVPISQLVSKRKWVQLMGNYGLPFLKGWLWHFEEEQMYEWCAEIKEVIIKYE